MEYVRKVSDIEYELEISSTFVVSFKVDEDFLKLLDYWTVKLGYKNRSDLIRDAIIEYLKYLSEKGI